MRDMRDRATSPASSAPSPLRRAVRRMLVSWVMLLACAGGVVAVVVADEEPGNLLTTVTLVAMFALLPLGASAMWNSLQCWRAYLER